MRWGPIFFVALLISYLIMVAVFTHWGWPLLILTSVPIGISGGIAGLYLLNLGGAHLDRLGLYPIQQPFDMLTMLGFFGACRYRGQQSHPDRRTRRRQSA